MCWKVTFGHHFDNNFWTVRNFWTRPEWITKHTFVVWIWTQIFYFFDWNRDFYHPMNMSHRGTRNTGSTYVRMEERKNGSRMTRSWIWQGNIFPISWDQSPRNKFLGKKYVSGKLFTSSNHLEKVLKTDLRSPFRQ